MTDFKITSNGAALLLAGLAIGILLMGCAPASQPAASLTPSPIPATPSAIATSTAVSPTQSAAATITPETATPMATGTPDGASPAPASPTARQAGCPNLDSRLYGLTTAADPAAYAGSNGLYYTNGRVRAVVELQHNEDSLPTGYDLTVESRQGALVQALIPVSDLCRLSNEPEVRYVRAPAQPGR